MVFEPTKTTCDKCGAVCDAVYYGTLRLTGEIFCPYCIKELEVEDKRDKEAALAEKARKLKEAYDEKTEDIRNNPSKYLSAAGIGARHSSATMADFEGGGTKTEVLKWLSGTRSEFVLIQGASPGTGKTHLACAMAHEFVLDTHDTPLFIPAVDMLLCARDTFHKDSAISEDRVIQAWRDVPLLIIDDFGTEKTSDYSQQVMYQVINSRYNSMMPTIITTNASSADIKEKNGTRIFSRIASGLIIVLDGSDLRAKNRKVVK